MSQLGKDMLEAESRAMLQRAATVWKKRHFSLSCREETASCDSRSLLPSPRFIFHTAAIDKTVKEQEVSLAEAAGRATCGYTANEPKWSTLLKGMNKFPGFDCIVNSRSLAVLKLSTTTLRGTFTHTAITLTERRASCQRGDQGTG